MKEFENQMTLKGLIERLQELHIDTVVMCEPHLDSYRGYYEDLMIEPSSVGVSVTDLLRACEWADGETFTGYKGGEFTMSLDTPVFVAHYGRSGKPLKNITSGGELEVFEDVD